MEALRRRLGRLKGKAASPAEGNGWVAPSNAVTRAIYGAPGHWDDIEPPSPSRARVRPAAPAVPALAPHFESEVPLQAAVPLPPRPAARPAGGLPALIDDLGQSPPGSPAAGPTTAAARPPVLDAAVPDLIDGLDDLPGWTPPEAAPGEPAAAPLGEDEAAA